MLVVAVAGSHLLQPLANTLRSLVKRVANLATQLLARLWRGEHRHGSTDDSTSECRHQTDT